MIGAWASVMVNVAGGSEVQGPMAEYSAAFKARLVKHMVGPQGVSATRLAATVWVPQPTLSRWVREVRSMDAMPRRERTEWTGVEKLRVALVAKLVAGLPAGRPGTVRIPVSAP